MVCERFKKGIINTGIVVNFASLQFKGIPIIMAVCEITVSSHTLDLEVRGLFVVF